LDDTTRDSATKAQAVSSILQTSQRMRHLVDGLLELARGDSGSVKLHFEQVAFSEIVINTLLPFEALFFERELDLVSQIAPDILVCGNADALKQMIDILLDNAQKYSVGPGQVNLSLEPKGNHCLLRLASPGAPFSREDCKNIFKRFYRIDPSRTHTGSYGLGLSIAQQLVQAHNGRIWAESEEGSNIFCVLLPMI
jgi:signal transduction histidine kinase